MTRSGTELKHAVQARNGCAVTSPSLVGRSDRCRRAAAARRDPFGRRQAVNEHPGEHFVILTDAVALEHGQAGKPAAARACAAVFGSDGTLVNALCVGGAHDMRWSVMVDWTRMFPALFNGTRSLPALCLACLPMLCESSFADSAEAADCVRIEEAATRLACYDRAHGRAETRRQSTEGAASAVAAEAASGPVAGAAETGAPADTFGAEHLPRNGADPDAGLDRLEARVTEARRDSRGNHVLRLDNGQTWQQIEAGDSMPADAGDTVKIWRGLFDAYYLRRTSGGKTVKVRRTE